MDFRHPMITHCVALTLSREAAFPIVLRYADHVVVAVSHADDFDAFELLGSGLDVNGDGLIKLPVDKVTIWLTDEQAENWQRGREADEKLLRYAR